MTETHTGPCRHKDTRLIFRETEKIFRRQGHLRLGRIFAS